MFSLAWVFLLASINCASEISSDACLDSTQQHGTFGIKVKRRTCGENHRHPSWFGDIRGGSAKNQDSNLDALLEEMKDYQASVSFNTEKHPRLQSAIQEYTKSSHNSTDIKPISTGKAAWTFLASLAHSPIFQKMYWQKSPLLIRAKQAADVSGGVSWIEGAFTVEKDLSLVADSYISGYQTSATLRNHIPNTTSTNATWQFEPLKPDPTRKTTLSDLQTSLSNGTVYFNNAGSLWPNLAALCRLTDVAFGFPSNVNIYASPPKIQMSVPPHTDKQDVIIFQTQGAKRWRVYAPPPRRKNVENEDPLGRGKNGNVLSFDELEGAGEPLLDVVLKKGDVLYVPPGFPHTTDTCTNVDEDTSSSSAFEEVSVHLTMGLDTHVWFLTYAHLRWVVLQRSQKDFQVKIAEEGVYWESLEALPIGFLGDDVQKEEHEGLWRKCVLDAAEEGKWEMSDSLRGHVRESLKRIMRRMEPHRWAPENTGDSTTASNLDEKKEAMPKDQEIDEAIEYFFDHHWRSLLKIQHAMYTDVDPHSDDTIMKAFQCSQEQDALMERFGKFCGNDGMENAFRERRLMRERRMKGVA